MLFFERYDKKGKNYEIHAMSPDFGFVWVAVYTQIAYHPDRFTGNKLS
jgi:hypothetical protein